jgi:hypothetical protein
VNTEPFGADQPIDTGDQRILRELGGIHDLLDPMPSELLERIEFAIAVAELEADIAELSMGELVGARSEQTDSVTFTSGALSLMVTTVVSVHHVRVDGWVTSPSAEIDVVGEGLTRTATADGDGRFSVEGIPRGRAHFVVRRDGYRPVITPAIEI